MDYWIHSPLNPRRIDRTESEAFILGRGAHHLLLGEDDFGRYFVARPEELNGKAWNGNRTDCREWMELAAEAGQTVLTPGQMDSIKGMAGILPSAGGLGGQRARQQRAREGRRTVGPDRAHDHRHRPRDRRLPEVAA